MLVIARYNKNLMIQKRPMNEEQKQEFSLTERTMRKYFPKKTPSPTWRCKIGQLQYSGNMKSFSKEFKRNKSFQTFTLDFEENLTHSETHYLSKGLKKAACLEQVTLHFGSEIDRLSCCISNAQLKSLMIPLKKQKFLEKFSLTIRNAEDLTDEAFGTLSHSLKGYGHLKDLNFDFDWCNFVGDESLYNFSLWLPSLGSSLKKLRLRYFESGQVYEQGLMCLSFCLPSLVHLEEVSLEFSGHEDISDEGIKILAEKLSVLTNLQSISMTLKRNKYITDRGIFHLTTCFKSSLKSIVLDFTGFQHLSHQGLMYLQEALQTLTSLQKFSLDLTSCKDMHELAMSHLTNGLQNLTTLQDLTLIFSKCDIINDESLSSLARLIKKLNKSLKRVHFDFSSNLSLGDEGLLSLFESLKTLNNLQALHVDLADLTNLSEKGLLALRQTLEELDSIQSIISNFQGSPTNKF